MRRLIVAVEVRMFVSLAPAWSCSNTHSPVRLPAPATGMQVVVIDGAMPGRPAVPVSSASPALQACAATAVPSLW